MATCRLLVEALAEWHMWVMPRCSGTCILLICTLPSLLQSVSTSVFCYSREYHANIHVNCLVPPGIVATQWSSGPYPLWFLSMDVARGETVRCSNILSFPSFQTYSGCSGLLLTSQGWTFAFNGLEPIWMSLRKVPMEANTGFIHFTSPSGNVISHTLLQRLDESTPSKGQLWPNGFQTYWSRKRWALVEALRSNQAYWHQAWTIQIPSPSPHSSYFAVVPVLLFNLSNIQELITLL